MRLMYSEIVLRVFGKINSSPLTSSMPPCLRVSSPKISVCSHLPFQVRYIFPITELYLYAAPFLLPNPSNRPKESHRPYIRSLPLKRWPRQHNLPLILPYSQHPKPASEFVASTPPCYSASSLVKKYYSFKATFNVHHISSPLPFLKPKPRMLLITSPRS